MKAVVMDYIKRNTVDGVAPSRRWMEENTNIPVGALIKRLQCKYSDLVAEAGAVVTPQGRRKGGAANAAEPFRR